MEICVNKLTGKEVRVLSKFSDLWFVTEDMNPASPNPKIIQVLPTQCEPKVTKEGPTLSPAPVVTSPGDKVAASSVSANTVEANNQSVVLLDVNRVTSFEELLPLKGIGKVFAKKILHRRPEGGYTGWPNLAALNADIQVDWNEVQNDNPGVIFSVVD